MIKISIITPSLNNASFIRDTIQSVLDQNYDNFEHIIIDGGSTDGTIEVLKEYPHLKWVSEKDSGQSNAINKGFAMANGDVVAWLNADDYYEKNIFLQVADFFKQEKDCFFLYGGITFVNKSKELIAYGGGAIMTFENLIKRPYIVRQPSCFWRKEVVDTIGTIDESLHMVMDYDYFLKIAKAYKMWYINCNVSYFRVHENCKTSKFKKLQNSELLLVMKKYVAFPKLNFSRMVLLHSVDNIKDTIKSFIQRR